LPQEVLDMVKEKRGEPMAMPTGEDAEEQPPAEEPEPQPEPEKEQAPTAEHEEPLPEEWPASAKARVKQEAEKRRKAKDAATRLETERNQWQQTAEQLHGQLQQSATQQGAPPPTMEDPLADVMDGPGLLRARKQFWEMLEFAEKHPDGVDDYVLGTDAKGQEIRMDYSRDDIVKMKLTAMEVLAQGIGNKAAYLQQVDAHAQAAKDAVPELFDTEPNEANKIAGEILRKMPPQLRATVAEWPLLLADAVAGRMQRLAKSNGAPHTDKGGKPLSKSAQAILGAPKTPVAPGMARSRAVERGPASAGNRAVEIEKAKQAHIDSGFSSETLERLLAIKRQGAQQTGNRSPALV
jgi:hypothetical protein